MTAGSAQKAPSVARRHCCPQVMRTGRYGCWAACRCGWTSELMTSPAGAAVAWAEHLRATLTDEERR